MMRLPITRPTRNTWKGSAGKVWSGGRYRPSRDLKGRNARMKRREFLKSTLAGATALAAPRIIRAEKAAMITFVPPADLGSSDPVWTTADITRNFALAVYDTLSGSGAHFTAQPQRPADHP